MVWLNQIEIDLSIRILTKMSRVFGTTELAPKAALTHTLSPGIKFQVWILIFVNC